MNAEAAVERSSHLDTLLLLAALAVIGGSIGAFYYFENEVNVLLRVLGLFAAGAAAIFLALQTAYGRQAWGAIQGSRIEMRRVVWPTRKEAVQATLMIAVVVFVLAIFMWGLDAVLLWAVRGLTQHPGA